MPRRRAAALLAAVALLLAGCGLKPAPFPTPDTELGQRPGLLSGPTGEFTVYCCH